jgi:poly-gamma-glutamate capsule biosynthesis protein CapA/YwtB (metallophosphatase superfamily)
MTNMRNALKALGAVLAVVALCAPLMLLPGEDTQPVLGYAGVTLTVPPTVVVATTIPGLVTTTTTTEAPPQPPASVPTSSTTTTTGPIRATIAAVGDILAPEAVMESVRDPQTGSYDFGPTFAPIAPYLFKADYTVGALGPRLAGPEAGYSAEPVANAPRELAFELKKTGMDLVATANSHSLDLGWEGLVGTLDRLDDAGLSHVGTSRSQQERNTPVIADIRGIRVAFLNYTASVAGKLPADGQKDFAVNMLDLETVTQDAATARSWGADAVVAMLDYGTEYDQQPRDDQVALSEQILNHGVDAILGYSARLVQPIGHIFTYASWRANDKYVAYSLGDFLSAQEPVSAQAADSEDEAVTAEEADSAEEAVSAPRRESSQSGLVAYLHLEKRELRTYVTGVSYLPLYFQAVTGEKTAKYRILPVFPFREPDTDVPLTADDRKRMAQVWEDARSLLFRPNENISPLAPADLGL